MKVLCSTRFLARSVSGTKRHLATRATKTCLLVVCSSIFFLVLPVNETLHLIIRSIFTLSFPILCNTHQGDIAPLKQRRLNLSGVFAPLKKLSANPIGKKNDIILIILKCLFENVFSAAPMHPVAPVPMEINNTHAKKSG